MENKLAWEQMRITTNITGNSYDPIVPELVQVLNFKHICRPLMMASNEHIYNGDREPQKP